MSAAEHKPQVTGQSPAPRRWLWPVVAVLVIVAALWASGAFKKDAPPPKAAPPAVPVKTVLAQSETVPVALRGIGSVMPVASVTVHTRIDGQLDSLSFKEGQDVKAGQVLARIDPRTFQAAVQQAEAAKARDEAQLANARADLARYGQLIKEDATSQQTLDTQKALVNQLAATIKNDDATINAARVQLSFTTISAPISGRIGARLVDAGNIVHAADANGLLVINQIDPIAVQFTVPESSFQAVNAALHAAGSKPLPVDAIDRATGDILASGHLILLNNQIDTSTGTIALKAQFTNAEHKLWPGQSVDARIVLSQQSAAVTVPSAVVQRSQDGYFAYVVEPSGDQVRMQPIDVADTIGGNKSVIGKGLKAGDRVVLDGQYRLMPGAHITENKPAAAPAASAVAPAASGAQQ